MPESWKAARHVSPLERLKGHVNSVAHTKGQKLRTDEMCKRALFVRSINRLAERDFQRVKERQVPRDLSKIGVGDDAIGQENLKKIEDMSPEEIKEAQSTILA